MLLAERVLLLGEGDGRALERLLAIAPQAHFHVIEVSPEMIALARQRTRDSARITFYCQDARTANWPAAYYDAVVTNFFLDCFTEDEARDLVRRLATSLTPNGSWLIGEFAIPGGGWPRLHAQIWIRMMYRFFNLTTGLRARELPPIGTLMGEAGMECVEGEQQRAGLMVSELWMQRPGKRQL